MNIDSRTAARHGKIERLYSGLIYGAAAAAFGYLVFRMFVPIIKGNTSISGIKLMLVLPFCLAALWLSLWYTHSKMDIRTCDDVVVFLIAINFILQLICLMDLRVNPSWDFGAVMKAADDIAEGKLISYITYYQEYPFNLNTAVIIGTFQYLSGGSVWAPYALNIFAVTSSVVGACLLARRVAGPAASVMTGAFCAAATPLYLYIPIVYTDTLSMPFAIWTLYVWSLTHKPAMIDAAEDGSGANSLKRLAVLYVLIGLLSSAGYLIKPTAAAGLAVIIVESLLAGRRHAGEMSRLDNVRSSSLLTPSPVLFLSRRIIPPVIALSIALVSIAAFKYYIDAKGYTERINYNKSIPFTHWIMMGMNGPAYEGGSSAGYGGFSAYDVSFSRLYPTKAEKMQAELIVIKERLRIYGFEGYSRFLLKKLEWTWTDGTYYAPVKLARRPLQITRLHTFVLYNTGLSSKVYRAYSKVTQLTLLLLIFIGCIFGLAGRNKPVFRAMTLICLGIMAFLLVWETRSRYLVNMIPVFIVMAALAADMAFHFFTGIWLEKRQEK